MLDKQFGKFDLRQRSGYRRFLEASAAALLPLEDALVHAGVEHIFPDWTLRSRRRAILHDIARIGGVVHPLAALPKLNFGQVLGTMYVLEGSRLGAQVLLKTVSQSSDPAVAAATAYLGHGAGQHLWRSFLVMLERHGATLKRTLSSEKDVVDGARQAFALFAHAVESLTADAGVAR
jgi:heme oxygenase